MTKILTAFILIGALTVAAAPLRASEVVDGNTAFALDLYRELAAAEGNLFFSPYSLSAALAMTYAGARGDTADEMRRTLHFPEETQALHKEFKELADLLAGIQREGDVRLSIANALWIQTGYELLEEFIRVNRDFYDAGLFEVDFEDDPDASRIKINRWVEEQTEGKIEDLLKPGIIKDLTRLVLTNAIYFLGAWENPFNPESTSDLDFWSSQGKRMPIPMMFQQQDFRYAETDSVQVLEMPYKGGGLAMLVLLPKERFGLPSLEKDLDPARLKELTASLSPAEVKTWFPRFRFEAQFGLKPILSAMGMPLAFTRDADFSGMEPKKELKIHEVVHKTFVDVDEKGTEAAAATAVVMMVKAALPSRVIEFRADHPFLFFIRDTGTGAILFMGRLAVPASS